MLEYRVSYFRNENYPPGNSPGVFIEPKCIHRERPKKLISYCNVRFTDSVGVFPFFRDPTDATVYMTLGSSLFVDANTRLARLRERKASSQSVTQRWSWSVPKKNVTKTFPYKIVYRVHAGSDPPVSIRRWAVAARSSAVFLFIFLPEWIVTFGIVGRVRNSWHYSARKEAATE